MLCVCVCLRAYYFVCVFIACICRFYYMGSCVSIPVSFPSVISSRERSSRDDITRRKDTGMDTQEPIVITSLSYAY